MYDQNKCKIFDNNEHSDNYGGERNTDEGEEVNHERNEFVIPHPGIISLQPEENAKSYVMQNDNFNSDDNVDIDDYILLSLT
jgi:hypothetical protein